MSSRFNYLHKVFLSFIVVISLFYGGSSTVAPIYGYKVVAKYPHSTDSYTEGFFYLTGMFYEGTGINRRSAVMVIDPNTGRSIQRRDLPAEYFGEAIRKYLAIEYDRAHHTAGWTCDRMDRPDGNAASRSNDRCRIGSQRNRIRSTTRP